MLIQQQIKINELEELLKQSNSVNKTLTYIRRSGGISAEINETLFKMYHAERDKGTSLEDITARTILILANENLIGFVFKNFIEYNEDLYSCAKLGLIRAIDNYEPNKSAFTTFAIKVILNEIYAVNRSIKNKVERRCGVSSFDDIINELNFTANGDNQITLHDIIADDYDFRQEVAEKDLIEHIKSLFKYLTPIEQQVLMYHTGLNGAPLLKQTEISSAVGYNQSNVSRIIKRASNKLNKILAGEDCSNMKTYELVDMATRPNKDVLTTI